MSSSQGSRDILALGAVEAAAQIRAGRLGCAELVRAHVGLMRERNPALNAITLDCGDQAIEAASTADRTLATMRREGTEPGPLFGLPVTIKENIDVAGQATPNGVPAFRDLIATQDSPVARNLNRAGAILIGRTNTPEYSFRAFTDNPLHGLTRNPWDPAITCGGSSGGAGAAAAAGIACINHGNDIGGSLRYPAYCNGVATIKPTFGRVPAFNPSQLAERPALMQMMSVQGPIARNVADARLGLAAMAIGDPRDPWWVPAPLAGEAEPPRVAVPAALDRADLHPAVRNAIAQAAEHLAASGYVVERVDAPAVEPVMKLWIDLAFAEMRVMQDAAMRPNMSEAMAGIVDAYYAMAEPLEAGGYMAGLAARAHHLREWQVFLARYSVMLTPLSFDPPYPVGEDLKGAARVAEIFDRFRWMSSINLLGLPAAIVSTGLHDGAPIGVQLVGRRFREDLCLDAAQAIEDRVGVVSERLRDRENRT
ncbi:MAG: amidase [Burkholderiaceae bacterium]|nr:amidase [Burkholderiaceae bacterium]